MKIFSSWIHDVWMISGFTFLILIEIGFSLNFYFHQKSDPHKMAATCKNIYWRVDTIQNMVGSNCLGKLQSTSLQFSRIT